MKSRDCDYQGMAAGEWHSAGVESSQSMTIVYHSTPSLVSPFDGAKTGIANLKEPTSCSRGLRLSTTSRRYRQQKETSILEKRKHTHTRLAATARGTTAETSTSPRHRDSILLKRRASKALRILEHRVGTQKFVGGNDNGVCRESLNHDFPSREKK